MIPILMFSDMKHKKILTLFVAGALMIPALNGCKRDPNDPGIEYAPEMVQSIPYDVYKLEMDSTSPFADKQVMQSPPSGTIPRGGHAAFAFGPGDSVKASPAMVAMQNPITATPAILEEGKILYTRFCSVCHGSNGMGEGGDGSVAKHDAINPPNLNSGKWVTYSPGQIYHTIMYGQGVMGSYASQLDYDERWKVIHYVVSLRGEAATPAADSTATPNK